MDLTPSGEDQKRSDELLWDEARKFAIEGLLAIEQRRQDLADREAGDPGDRCPKCAELGHSDCYEAGRRAGREDAARDIAQAIDSAAAADRTPRLVGHDAVQLWDGRQFAYDHSAALARAARVPDCGDQYHGADGGPCQGCGFDVTEKG